MPYELLSPEETLEQLSDVLISSVLKGTDESKHNKAILFGQVNPRLFRNEHYILYRILYNYKEQRIVPTKDFISMLLLRNPKFILEAGNLINMSAFADLDEIPEVAYTAGVLQAYDRLIAMETKSEDDFRVALETYKIEYKTKYLGDVFTIGKRILHDGYHEGRKYYHGYDDCLAYTKKGIAEIESVLSTTGGAGFIDATEYGMQDDSDKEVELIGDFGDIKELNEIYGGIYTGTFYSVTAPTKGGKSKFCADMTYNVRVKHGQNVVCWAHEGGVDMWLAQMRAIHFDRYYNKDETDASKIMVGVDQKTILYKSFKSDAMKELEQVSRSDFFTNPNYGQMYMIDRPFNVETFIDEIETAVQLCNAKYVVIDYLQLIGSEVSNSKKAENIGKAYQLLLAYCKARNVTVVSPAQFKQDFIKEASKQGNLSGVENRTAGGESSEITRTPDINIGLYATVSDLENNKMQIISIPSRLSKMFKPIDIYCDLGTCYFCSQDES